MSQIEDKTWMVGEMTSRISDMLWKLSSLRTQVLIKQKHGAARICQQQIEFVTKSMRKISRKQTEKKVLSTFHCLA